ncbi:mitochondrial carrier domain-containing protein [Trichoderma chlorosporum]
MCVKHQEPSLCNSQNTENPYVGGLYHQLCPHESTSRHSHLEDLTLCLSNTSIRSLAGATSGVASSVVTCPLDVMKTKLQARDGLQLWTLDAVSKRRSFQNRGMIGTGRAIWHEGGLIGMYQGLGPIMLASFLRGTIHFPIYHKINDFLIEKLSPQHILVSSCISAVAGGACSTLFTYPLWVIKTRLQSQSSISIENTTREYKSVIDVARKMYYREGVISFYSGLTPALLGVTNLAIQFPLYEQFKRYLTGTGLGSWREDQGRVQVLGILAASFASKACATAATYPHEVIRTRLQTQKLARPPSYRGSSMDASGQWKGINDNGGRPWKSSVVYQGIVNTLKLILRDEGWRALYSGMGTSLIGAIPASATTMLVYEVVVQLINKLRTEGRRKLKL